MAPDEHGPGLDAGGGDTREGRGEMPHVAEALRGARTPAAVKRGPGNPRTATKDLVSLRLDKEVLASLRAGGAGWQTRANQLLRAGLGLDSGSEAVP